jgi:streptogramin lyase
MRLRRRGTDGLLPTVSVQFAALLILTSASLVAQTITEFPTPSGGFPSAITVGSDGNLWFTEGTMIGRISTGGSVTEFPIASDYCGPSAITTGPDGNLWYVRGCSGGFGIVVGIPPVSRIGRITMQGLSVEFSAAGLPFDITAGPDGGLWFTELGGKKIGRISTAGDTTEYLIPTPLCAPAGIVAGPDGGIWFTDLCGFIGRISTNGTVTAFPLLSPDRLSYALTVGGDGNLWFAERGASDGQANWIGRMTLSGVVAEFRIPTPGAGAGSITAGADGNMWFTEPGYLITTNKIGRITTTGVITEFTAPTAFCNPTGITSGPDGNIWFAEASANHIGRVDLATCSSGASDLCLGIPGRFRTSVVWSTQEGAANSGTAVPITSNTGEFWFFDPTNLELVVKVLDGRSVDGHFWVFYGSLTNVEFILTVTDTVTGAVKTYFNPQGQLASVADTSAF